MKRLFLLVLAGCTMYAAPHSYGHQKTPQESLGDYARKQRAQTQAQQGVLKNDDVLRMTKAGLPDATIVSLIQQNGGTFDTSPDALIALKKGGVSSGVIDAMVAARVKAPNRANIFQNNSPAFSGRSTPTGDGGVPLPAEMGVYLLAGDKLNELEPEIVGWQTGGNIKRGVTLGWTHGHINGKVMHPHTGWKRRWISLSRQPKAHPRPNTSCCGSTKKVIAANSAPSPEACFTRPVERRRMARTSLRSRLHPVSTASTSPI
jgi:hypothetical protein